MFLKAIVLNQGKILYFIRCFQKTHTNSLLREIKRTDQMRGTLLSYLTALLERPEYNEGKIKRIENSSEAFPLILG
ncbi:MAG: hypothetical protein LBO67_05220 [Spirochaetaceae bacterium]|jgi:hypothetical protein|nr:hypothetical protein [Spirochaetaceae bacterium]